MLLMIHKDRLAPRGVVIADAEKFAAAVIAASVVNGDYHNIPDDVYESIVAEHQKYGVGDMVHNALAPAVRVIDAALGTDLEHCDGCDNRRKGLNEFFS